MDKTFETCYNDVVKFGVPSTHKKEHFMIKDLNAYTLEQEQPKTTSKTASLPLLLFLIITIQIMAR